MDQKKHKFESFDLGMRSAPSFIAGLSLPTLRFPSSQYHGRPVNRVCAVSKRQRTVIVRCQNGNSDNSPESREIAKLEGELQDMYKEALNKNAKESDKTDFQRSDRRVMEGIAEVGVNEMQEIAGGVQKDLENAETLSESFASDVMATATDSLLEKFDNQKKDLLEGVERDREVIKEELDRVKQLADKVTSPVTSRGGLSTRGKILFGTTSMFSLAAIFYTFTGLVDSDGAAMQSAAIDAVCAAATVFFYSREVARAKGGLDQDK